MQVKVLYSFNDNPTVFLSRSRQQHSVKVVQIPCGEGAEDQMITLGAFDLRSCVNQITKNSPENFNLQAEDYAVYYKDITEQPDEPFVGNGVLSSLIGSAKSHVVPGRVCQNLSASFLFGDKNSSSLTLEIKLKLHTIEKLHDAAQPAKRENSFVDLDPAKRVKKAKAPSASSSVPAARATRTKSLPIFYHPHNQQIHNIINADKSNAPSRYDSKSVQDRFKLAPFMQAKILDDPASLRKKKRSSDEPQRAVRTRSMLANTSAFTSTPGTTSPIQEEMYSDETDDTEYNDRNNAIEEGDEEEEDDAFDERSDNSPYTPQQPPYKPLHDQFESLPDFESLGKKTHTIPNSKLPHDHGLICINENCSTDRSITWRYFEQKNHPPSLALLTAEKFDKSLYKGMFGPLCNACYLFLRTKGFMRPPAVVKKYLQQQRYKKEQRDGKPRLDSVGSAKAESSSSPFPRFVTPSHTPSMINQVIENNKNKGKSVSNSNYNDLNEFMNQLNSFGGPLTDIDPLPQDQGITPPMIATKSNTRVINLYDDQEDKENQPPSDEGADDSHDFERLIKRSFSSDKHSSPNSQWIDTLFVQPTPKDGDKPTPIDGPKMRTFTVRSSPHKAGNMPSSPLVKDSVYDLDEELNQLVSNHQDYFDVSSPATKATRSNTTMSWSHSYRKQGSTPNTELYSDEKVASLDAAEPAVQHTT